MSDTKTDGKLVSDKPAKAREPWSGPVSELDKDLVKAIENAVAEDKRKRKR